jgi:hypothetical protein
LASSCLMALVLGLVQTQVKMLLALLLALGPEQGL